MFSRRQLRNSGWIAGALAIVALAEVSASGQNDAAEPRPPVVKEEKAPAEERPPAAMMGMQASGLAELLEENRQSYRTVLVSELRFCRSACSFTKEQIEKIAARAGALIEPAVLDSATAQERAQKQGGIRRADEPEPPNKVRVVRSFLQKLVSEYATPEQQARYQAEKTKRAARAKESAIDALVARLDRLLVLSSSQRAQLLKIFESNWDDEWAAMQSVIGDDDGPLPAIPDRLVVPYLSPTQVRLWKKHDKQGIDATEAYVSILSEILEGLPSEFMGTLEQAAREAAANDAAKAAGAKPTNAVSKQKP